MASPYSSGTFLHCFLEGGVSCENVMSGFRILGGGPSLRRSTCEQPASLRSPFLPEKLRSEPPSSAAPPLSPSCESAFVGFASGIMPRHPAARGPRR